MKILLFLTLAFLSACDDSESSDSTVPSPWITIPGNSNGGGSGVIDVNNVALHFRVEDGLLQRFDEAKAPAVYYDSNNSTGYLKGDASAFEDGIGVSVQLVASDKGAPIAGLVADDGTAVELSEDASGNPILGKTNLVFLKPYTNNDPTKSASYNCTENDYKGPNQDPQIDSYCKNAFINKCLDAATGTNTYAAQTKTICSILDGLLTSGTAKSYCTYCN